MKRKIQLIPILMAFITISNSTLGQHVKPIRTMQIPYAYSAATIDGYADESFYSASQNTVAFNKTGSTGADADYTMSFKVAYDETYLYLAATILDDYNNSWDWGLTNQWTYDNIEVFIDLDTNGSGTVTAYDNNTIQIRFNRGIDSVNDYGRAASRAEYLYAWENTADGWVFEAGIPWTCVLGSGQLPEDIYQYFSMVNGFDVNGADSDTDGPDARDCQTAWDNDDPQTAGDRTEDNAWNNRSVFGIVEFLTPPTPPPPPPPPPSYPSSYVKPVRTMQIPYASSAAIIDGYADESFYSASQNTVAFNPTGSTGADADYTMSFKVAYDETYLYLAASVIDDYDNSWDWGLSSQWTYDNVEVFFDLDTNGSGTATAYDDNTIQIRFNRGIDSVNDYGRAASRAEYLYYWENTADGWIFEAGIPWTCVLGNGQLPEDIYQYFSMVNGFDVSGADSDTDGPDARDCQTAWDNDNPQTADDRTEDNAWNNRSVFGVVEFLTPPTPPPPPPPPPPPSSYVKPVRTMQIPYASSAAIIDGYADEAFYSAEQNTVAFNKTGSTGADADYTMSFKVAYDETYLYLAATILDDYNNSWDWGLTNQWTWDNVEVFFDLDTNGSGTVTAYDTNTIQIRFNRGIDSVNDYGRAASRTEYLYAWENTSDGWVFEAGIPWTCVLGNGQLPEDIYQYFSMVNGFDVSGADSDTDGPDARDCQTAWDNDDPQTAGDRTEDNAWNNRSVFGIVEFLTPPSPPPPPPSSYVKPVRTMQIPYASSAAIIDGYADESFYSTSQNTVAFNPTGSTGADADYTMSFKVAYDETYLYLAATMLDDYDNSWDWGLSSQWMYDNVEVFFDLDTNGSGTATAYDTNTIQIRFNRGIDSVNDFGRAAGRAEYLYYWENTADGWVFEAGIPWTFVLGKGQLPEDINQYFSMVNGFDVHGADSDTDGPDAHACQTAWDQDGEAGDAIEDNAWNNRSVFGIVEFLPGGVTPPPPPSSHVKPVRTMQIPYASDAVTIDGYADESFYSAKQTTDAFNKTGCYDYPSADYTMSFKVAYDETYLYLAATMLDDYDNSWDWGSTNQWTYDNVEVYFDLDTNGSGTVTTYDNNTIQIRFNRGIDSVNDYGRAASRAEYLYYWENTADGWLFEAGIPWTCVLGNGQLPEDIYQYFSMVNGFDVHGADSDTDGPDSRDCQTAWDNDNPQTEDDRTEDNAWNNRSVFGIVEFLPGGGSTIGIDPIVMKNSYIVTPNPASNSISISKLSAGSKVEVLNLFGQCVIHKQVEFDTETLDIRGINPGIYLIRVTVDDKQSGILKFIKK